MMKEQKVRAVYTLLGNNGKVMQQINSSDATLEPGQIVVFSGYGEERESVVTGEQTSTNEYITARMDGKGFGSVYAGNISTFGTTNRIGYYHPRPGQRTQISPEILKAVIAVCNRHESQMRLDRDAKFRATEQQKARGQAIFEATKPSWAKAVIMARFKVNESDGMTDYYGHKTTRTVVLCFSKSTRNNFSEMRKAAATFEPTSDLAGMPADEVEHREDYTGGGGYYLGGHRHSGWEVYKSTICGYTLSDIYRAAGDEDRENYLPGQKSKRRASGRELPESNAGVTISFNEEKGGIELRFAADERPPAEVMEVLSARHEGVRTWRWHRTNKYWWAKDNEGTRVDAKTIANYYLENN